MVLLVWFTGCTPAGPQALLDGKRLLDEGKYSEAVGRLQLATSLLATNAQAWNYLGLAYHHNRQAAEGVEAYRHALRLNSDLIAAHYNLGCLLLEQNTPESLAAARNELTAFTMRQPNALDGWHKLGAAQLRLADLTAAETSFKQALRLDPQDIESLNDLGLAQLERRRWREAVAYFNAALKLQPEYGPAILNLAVAEIYLGNRPLALQKYREYLALSPKPANWDAVNTAAQQLDASLNPPPRPVITNTTPIAASPVTNAARPEIPVVAPKPVESNKPPPKPEVVTLTEAPAIRPAESIEPVSQPSPPLNVPSAAAPSQTANLTSTAAISPSVNPVFVKPEKKSFLERLNPMTYFRRSKVEDTPARITIINPPITNTLSQPKTDTLSQPKVAVTEPTEARKPAPQPVREISVARYPYLPAVVTAAGNRAEAERLLARGVEAERNHKLEDAMAAFHAATLADPGYFDAQSGLGLAAYELGDLPTALRADELALAIKPDSFAVRYNFGLALKKANYFIDAAQELENLLAASAAGEPPERLAVVHLTLANLYSEQLHQNGLARNHYLKVLELDPQNSQATSIRYWLRDNS